MGVVMESAPVYEYDGRVTEEAVSQLAVLPEMEWRTSVLRLILKLQERVDENTDVTADTQEMVSRSIGKVDEMYAFLLPAQNFFKAIGVLGNGLVRAGRWFLFTVEFMGRLAKPVFWIIAIFVAGLTYFKTGSWHMPEWWKWFLE